MNITTHIYLSMGRSCIDYEKSDRNYVWYNQETRKGNWTMMLHVNEGGWVFNDYYGTLLSHH